MNSKPTIGGILLLAFVLLTFCAASAQVASHAPTMPSQPSRASLPAPSSKPVARVNGAVLTETDLLREEYSIFPYARQHGGVIPAPMEPQIRQGAMKMIIFEELVYQEAERRKMTVSPAQLRLAETAFRKQFDTPQEYNALLQSEFHGSQKLLQSKIERSLLIEALLKSEIDSKSAVSRRGQGFLRQESGPLPVSGVIHFPDDFLHSAGEGDAAAIKGSG